RTERQRDCSAKCLSESKGGRRRIELFPSLGRFVTKGNPPQPSHQLRERNGLADLCSSPRRDAGGRGINIFSESCRLAAHLIKYSYMFCRILAIGFGATGMGHAEGG